MSLFLFAKLILPYPEAYPVLRELLGSTLPDIAPNDNRFSAWIYGGKPVTEREEESVWMQ